MSTERTRALRELEETCEELGALRRQIARKEAVRDQRIMRAVALGATRPECGEIAGLSRQRVQQITQAVARGETTRAEVRALAKQPTPREQVRAV